MAGLVVGGVTADGATTESLLVFRKGTAGIDRALGADCVASREASSIGVGSTPAIGVVGRRDSL